MSNTVDFTPLWEALEELVGMECWSCLGGWGSMFLAEFGEKIPLERPATNQKLREDQRCLEGECNLHVRCANWILLQGRMEVTYWDDPTDELTKHLELLEGETLLEVDHELSGPFARQLWFTKGVMLRFSGDFTLALDFETDLYGSLLSVKSSRGWVGLDVKGSVVVLRQES